MSMTSVRKPIPDSFRRGFIGIIFEDTPKANFTKDLDSLLLKAVSLDDYIGWENGIEGLAFNFHGGDERFIEDEDAEDPDDSLAQMAFVTVYVDLKKNMVMAVYTQKADD